MQIDDLGRRVLLQQVVAHRVHEVRLTQTHAAIQKQRVVTMPGVIRHLPGSSPGQLVGFTFDEVLEGKAAIQITGVLDDGIALVRPLRWLRLILFHLAVIDRLRLETMPGLGTGRRYRSGHRSGFRFAALNRSGGDRRGCHGSGDSTTAAADKQGQQGCLALRQIIQQFLNAVQVFVVDPIQHKTVRSVQAQFSLIALDLQRTNPGVEFLGWKLVAQKIHALLPEYNRH